jgi:hypothetical protein
MANPNLLVSGILSAVANPGFTRLFGKSSPANFVELNQTGYNTGHRTLPAQSPGRLSHSIRKSIRIE